MHFPFTHSINVTQKFRADFHSSETTSRDHMNLIRFWESVSWFSPRVFPHDCSRGMLWFLKVHHCAKVHHLLFIRANSKPRLLLTPPELKGGWWCIERVNEFTTISMIAKILVMHFPWFFFGQCGCWSRLRFLSFGDGCNFIILNQRIESKTTKWITDSQKNMDAFEKQWMLY